MKRTKTNRSPASAAIHETVAGLHELGIVDKETMIGFDESCLTPVRVFSPAEIRKLREREQISQHKTVPRLGNLVIYEIM